MHDKKLAIYCINLDRDTDKKVHVLTLFKKYNLKVKFIQAIDGKKLPARKTMSSYSLGEAVKTIGRELVKSEIGCGLSHKSIFQEIVDQGIEEALILEDDVYFDERLSTILKAVAGMKNRYDILFLGHHSCNAVEIPTAYSFYCKECLTDDYVVTKLLENVCGTYGYIVSLEGAKKLLGQLNKISKPIDHYTGDIDTLKVYGVVPPVISIDKKYHTMSTIEEERAAYEHSEMSFIKKIKRKLLAYRWIYRLYLVKANMLNRYIGIRHTLYCLFKNRDCCQ